MSFLKNNLFLISMIALVLVGAGIPLGLYLSWSSDVKAAGQDRRALAQRLQGLDRGEMANQAVIEAEQANVQMRSEAITQLKQRMQELNRQGHEVFSLLGMDGQPVPVFPLDKGKYDMLALSYTSEYFRQMVALFDRLGATSPPTVADVDDARRRIIIRLLAEKRLQNPAQEATLVLPPGVEPPLNLPTQPDPSAGGHDYPRYEDPSPYLQPEPMPFPGGHSRYTGSTTAVPGEEKLTPLERYEADRQALDAMRLTRARSGQLYADLRQAFQFYALPVDTAPTQQDMWKAQVNYWMHERVVGAILQTNAAVHRRRQASEPPTVLNSAVKRLVRVRVGVAPNQPYQLTGAAGGGSSLSDEWAMPAPDGGYSTTPTAQAAQNLTGRICTDEYDVVPCEVTVIIDSREILSFLRQIQSDNWSTVLNIRISEPGAAVESLYGERFDGSGGGFPSLLPGMLPAGGGTDPSRAGAASTGEHYYGTAPVVQLTVRVETLLFAQWQRDLMPVQMLQEFNAANAAALRPEDQTRLQRSGLTTTLSPWDY